MTRPTALIDATLFLGMHSADETLRSACKSFFSKGLSAALVMSLEQVGLCDDVVWRHERRLQDLYYPFMDTLHTVMAISRIAYSEADLRLALEAPRFAGLPVSKRLVAAMAANRGGTLYTVDDELLAASPLAKRPLSPGVDAPFPAPLEALYARSLALTFRVSPVAR